MNRAVLEDRLNAEEDSVGRASDEDRMVLGPRVLSERYQRILG